MDKLLKARARYYLESGLDKNATLKRIEAKLTEEEKNEFSEFIDSELADIKYGFMQKVFFVCAAFGVVALVILFSAYIVYFENSVYYPEKCPGAKEPLSVLGEPDYRREIVKAMNLIENSSCDYFNFVAANSKKIIGGKVGLFLAGYFKTDETLEIDTFTGSTYFVSSVLIHEACHSFQRKSSQPLSENDCTTTQYNYLRNINAPENELQEIENIVKQWGVQGYTLDGKDVFGEWKTKG